MPRDVQALMTWGCMVGGFRVYGCMVGVGVYVYAIFVQQMHVGGF